MDWQIILEEGNTIPADAKILANYDDKDRSQAKDILSKRPADADVGNGAPDNNEKKHEDHDGSDDGSEDEHEDEHIDKGPSILSVDQSAITGESLAVDKFVGEIAFYTCGVKRGKAYGVVTVSAKQSFVGTCFIPLYRRYMLLWWLRRMLTIGGYR